MNNSVLSKRRFSMPGEASLCAVGAQVSGEGVLAYAPCDQASVVAAPALAIASGFIERMRGFFAPRAPGCVLLLAPCHSIHTFGMRECLDVAFIDAAGVVLYAQRSVPPNRIVRFSGARAVLERKEQISCAWYCAGEEVKLYVRNKER